ncbi:MAG: FAD/FMN-containing dehydrogenase [Pseudohongiellaceae bacterium]|jgi:FAD/FMN-containing dehydrogenase
MNCSETELLAKLTDIVGVDWVKTSESDKQNYGKDWTKAFAADPIAIVLPNTVEDVQSLVLLANQEEFALVPSGGRTGLSGGAVAMNQEVVVAFDRMNQILDFSASDRQVVCQPGVITEQLQQYAQDKGLLYPVDFASSGSSQIGGNIATNAGGIKVIRYGMTRNWVDGLKVVTGSGELLDLNKGLAKNATGYDFRHLFVGSEGTLGFVVEATIGLCSQARDPSVLLLGVNDMQSTMPVLQLFRDKLSLTAFEFFSNKALTHVIAEKGLQKPFESQTEFYVLIEFENNTEKDLETAMTLFEQSMEEGWVLDGTISQNLNQAKSLWRLREDISETISQFTPYKNDISVKVARVPEFLTEVDELVSKAYPDFEIIWFGHIGDGNVHLNILKPEAMAAAEFFEECGKVSSWVFEIVKNYDGSVSAEHGVGLLKKPYLHYSRSAAELDFMRQIKRVFDPKNVMNPGKIFD